MEQDPNTNLPPAEQQARKVDGYTPGEDGVMHHGDQYPENATTPLSVEERTPRVDSSATNEDGVTHSGDQYPNYYIHKVNNNAPESDKEDVSSEPRSDDTAQPPEHQQAA